MKDPKWLLPVVAAFLMLSSLAHGILGWKAMKGDLVRTGASAELLADLATGWYLGSAAMAAFAVIIFSSWQEARGRAPAGRAVAGIIALVYLGFGMLAFLLRSFDRHFLIAFVIPGALLGVGVLRSKWAGPK